MRTKVLGAVAIGLSLAIVALPAWAQQGATDGQWRAYGGDNGATKYSSLDQITSDNVDDLQIAWEHAAVDESILTKVPDISYGDFGFLSTPLMIDGLLYSPNGVGLVEAFNPGTGETAWIQEPMDPGPAAYRGVATRAMAPLIEALERS